MCGVEEGRCKFRAPGFDQIGEARTTRALARGYLARGSPEPRPRSRNSGYRPGQGGVGEEACGEEELGGLAADKGGEVHRTKGSAEAGWRGRLLSASCIAYRLV